MLFVKLNVVEVLKCFVIVIVKFIVVVIVNTNICGRLQAVSAEVRGIPPRGAGNRDFLTGESRYLFDCSAVLGN